MTIDHKYRVPTVAIHTDKFVRAVNSVARVNGMPRMRQVFVPQPIMGKTPQEMRAYVDGLDPISGLEPMTEDHIVDHRARRALLPETARRHGAKVDLRVEQDEERLCVLCRDRPGEPFTNGYLHPDLLLGSDKPCNGGERGPVDGLYDAAGEQPQDQTVGVEGEQVGDTAYEADWVRV